MKTVFTAKVFRELIKRAGLALALALVAAAVQAQESTSAGAADASNEFEQPDAPEAPDPITDIKPISPQPGADAVSPGLAVQYFYDKFYILDEIVDAEDPVPGEPIANLNHASETDPVLTAEYPIMVGAKIRGLLHFEQPGTYGFRVNSNDGVRVWVGEELLWEDPEVHFDRMSPALEVSIDEAGWYDFKVDYFQKKGAAALQVLWTPPGGEETPVPPEAFAHLNK